MSRAAAWIAALALALPSAAAAESWRYSAEAFGGYDSNVGNSGTADDRRDAGFLQGTTSSTREQRYGRQTALTLTESIGLERWLSLGQLTNMRYAARLRVLHRPGRGFHSPILSGWIDAGLRHSASDIRRGYDYTAGVSATAPVTTAVVARVEVSRHRRKASGRAFELSVLSYSVEADWRLGARVTAYGGARIDDGDFVVTARGFGVVVPKDQHLYLGPRAGAIERDEAFGEDWWAFRVNGATVIGTLGLNVRLSPALALDAQVRRGAARMDRFTYERWVGSVGVLFRW